MKEGALIVLLAVLVVSIVVGTLVGAIILRAAVSLYNKLAGGGNSPSAVAEPAMGKAMGITFVVTLVNSIGGFLIGLAIGGAGRDGVVTAQLVSLGLSVVVMAGMLAAMLPTTLGRAFLVTMCHFLICLVIIGVIVGIGVAVFQSGLV